MTGTDIRYAALLRGVNVGGNRKLPMAELRGLMTDELGWRNVETYLQSGQAAFTIPASAPTFLQPELGLAASLSTALHRQYGVDIAVLVRDHAYLSAVVADCPFLHLEPAPKQLHVAYLSGQPDAEAVAALTEEQAAVDAAGSAERLAVGDHLVYLYLPEGSGRSRLAQRALRPAVLGKTTIVTARNWNTALKLAQMTAPR